MRANASSTSPPDDHQALQGNAEGTGFLNGLISLREAAVFLDEEFATIQRRPNEAGSKTLGVELFGLQAVWRRSLPAWRCLRLASLDIARHEMARSIVVPGNIGCDQHGVVSQPIADQIGRTSAPRC